MTPATRTALAYLHVTGNLPKGLHSSTYCAASRLSTRPSIDDGLAYRKIVKAEAAAEVMTHPLVKGHLRLLELGFEPEPYQRRTSHYVVYRHPTESCEAGVSRGGSIWITRINDCKPYRQTWHVAE